MYVELEELFYFSRNRLTLIVGAVQCVSFWVCCAIYGDEFLQKTYLYHVNRKDIKHNLSLYFHLLYLNAESANLLFKLAPFIPQLVLLTAVALLFCFKEHVGFCLFIQTYCFVIFNKVCTSQYFLWYLHHVSSIHERKSLFYLQHTVAHLARNGRKPYY